MFKANGKRIIGYCDLLQEDIAKKSIYISTSKRVRPRLSKAGPERPDLWFQSQLVLTQLNSSLPPPCQVQALPTNHQSAQCSVWQLFWKEMLEIFPTLQNFVQASAIQSATPSVVVVGGKSWAWKCSKAWSVRTRLYSDLPQMTGGCFQRWQAVEISGTSILSGAL